MESITLGEISDWLKFIAGILGSACVIIPVMLKFVRRVITNNMNEGLKPIEDKILRINKAAEKRLESYEKGLQCLLRNDILYVYTKCRESKEITMQEKQSINYSFEIYKNLGGNSFVADLIAEMNEFKVIN